ILAGIGVWEGVAAAAEPIREIRVADRDSPLHLHYDHRELGEEPLGFIVENRLLRRALVERLAALPAVRHIAPETVVAAAPAAAGTLVTLASGGSIRAALAVAAEGRVSPLRQATGIKVL